MRISDWSSDVCSSDLFRSREASHAGIPGLLAQADAAREAGQLTGDDKAALPLYQRILALQPENTGALEGREDALGELLQQARAQLRAGDLAEATAAIAAARRFDAGHVDLPDTQARLNEELDDVRRNAANALGNGQLERAQEGYRLLADAGQQADADAGLQRVAAACAHRAETLDRTSVVWGAGVAVSVGLGGRGCIKTKK